VLKRDERNKKIKRVISFFSKNSVPQYARLAEAIAAIRVGRNVSDVMVLGGWFVEFMKVRDLKF
jgi:hypothetical protein